MAEIRKRRILDLGVALGVTTVSFVWWLKTRKTAAEARQRAAQAAAQAAAAEAAAAEARAAADRARQAYDAAYGTSATNQQELAVAAGILEQQALDLAQQVARTREQSRE